MTGQATTERGFNLTPAEVRAKWVEALRSGRYRRGTGELRKRENGKWKHCCLGVLCDVLAKAGMGIEVDVMTDPYGDSKSTSYDGEELTLPQSILEVSGLVGDCGKLTEPVDYKSTTGKVRQVTELTEVNDEAGWSFRRIADLIESGGVRTTDDEGNQVANK